MLTLVETAVDSIRSYLQANLAGYITTVNAGYNDGITVPAVQNYFRSEPDRLNPAQTPAILITALDGRLDGDLVDWYSQRYPIEVLLVVALTPNADAVRPTIYRFTLATVQALVAAMKTGGVPGTQLFWRNQGKPYVSFGKPYMTGVPGMFAEAILHLDAKVNEAT